jgi:hypothetical protein
LRREEGSEKPDIRTEKRTPPTGVPQNAAANLDGRTGGAHRLRQ